jgi:hypothetical protein
MKSYHVIIKGFHIGLFMFITHSRMRFQGKITKDFLSIRLFNTTFFWGFRKKNVRTLIRRKYNWDLK